MSRLYACNYIHSTQNSAWDIVDTLMIYLLSHWILTYLFQLWSSGVAQSLEHAAAGGHTGLLAALLKQ